MSVCVHAAVILALCGTAVSQLSLVSEPPSRVWFSSASGARLSCRARGTPAPAIAWVAEDGSTLGDVPVLREIFPNGTLWLHPFTAAQYRADVHAGSLRCRAANSAGLIISRDIRLHAVMEVPWEVHVERLCGSAGGVALLRCSAGAARPHIIVTGWVRDGEELQPRDQGRYIIAGSRGDLLLIREVDADDVSMYSCEAQHKLTGEKKRSMATMVSITRTTASMAPRIVAISEDEIVQQGDDIKMVCCAIGNPPPTYSWFREENGRSVAVTNDLQVSVWGGALSLRRVTPSMGGPWSCRAHNALGEQRREASLLVHVPLTVSVNPPVQVANSGSTVQFNCSVSVETARVRWVHEGASIGRGERFLYVRKVSRQHQGHYQCLAETDHDSAQGSALLKLGETSPELQYTFIEQALHPGPALALRCVAAGAPPPRFSWLRDSQPIDEHNTPERSITSFLNSNGDVVSYLNITSVRPEDGGRYTCRAHNSRGVAEHSSRLNVYGPPSIRSIGPIRVVAGVNTTIYCPFSGFPISEIRWQRGGMDVGSSGTRTLSGVGGELHLWPAEQSDAGLYSCRVTSPTGQYAQKDMQIFVRNPPKISGFSFPSDLVEGSSVQVLCGITSGDKPVYFSWLKDGQHISPSLQVQEKSLEEFSFLIFSHVTSKHSGDYTCVASNSAAEVNHTARLAVKVAPTWIYEPQDVSALLGTQIIAHCITKGYPEPRVSWLKLHGPGPTDFRPVSTLDIQYSVLSNGSLVIMPASRRHEGQYMCRSENGIGRGLTKIISISVNEPAHFDYSSRNMTVKRTSQASLLCEASGDPPIQLQWTHNMKRVELTTYRVSISEKRSESGVSSQLNIAHAERHDSGVYRCRAENTYGRDELLIYLAVQEFPEAPRGLHISRHDSRSATIAWKQGYDGNARVKTYRLQYRVVGERLIAEREDWAIAPIREIPADKILERSDSYTSGAEVSLEFKIESLRPATAYALRLSAINAIGDSEYSDPVIVQTLEEVPSEAPHDVQVQATAPGEILVTWQAPPQESWNGELFGYVVQWSGAGRAGVQSVRGAGASSLAVGPVPPSARLAVRLRGYNRRGAGAASRPATVTTLEGVPEAPPERVRCEPLSSQSMRVWWEPPPPDKRGGILLGYELMYEAMNSPDGEVETRRSGGLELVLQALRRAGNYSAVVWARTAAGSGPHSDPVYCTTHQDIPGPPSDIKALANSEDSIIVSWLAPAHKNGIIKHYTVYSRPQRTGQHSQLTVLHKDEEEEYQVSVGGLQQTQLYEFWVTAATSAGEGDMSAVVARKPNAWAPPQIASFGRQIIAPEGSRVRLPCAVAGSPTPVRSWTRLKPAPAITADPRFSIEGYHLVIHSLDRAVCDNYTCTASSPRGPPPAPPAAAHWRVCAAPRAPPPAPTLKAAGMHRLHFVWDDGKEYSYILYYTLVGTSITHSRRVTSRGGVVVWGLVCGGRYRVRAGRGRERGEELTVSTKGGKSKPPSEKDFITSNNTCVLLNLLTWDSNGCPISQFTISFRNIEESDWKFKTVPLEIDPVVICDLTSASWYQLKVVATSDPGDTIGNYYFSTLTDAGERIPAPAVFPPAGDGSPPHSALVLAAAACALLAALLLLVVLAWRRSQSMACIRKGYQQGEMSEEEEKSVEKRDNRRNCQQVYTSSPIKHSLGKKDQQEMYEISPYATFSMSSAGGAGLVDSEDAPPPRRSRSRGGNNAEEYTLSRAMTLAVRRSPDSESSGSPPCAECSAHYRVPAKEEVFRNVTDSSAESEARSLPHCAGAGAVGGGRALDKQRRRPRRHHTPTSTRYQQRQEQERRDFTIHV